MSIQESVQESVQELVQKKENIVIEPKAEEGDNQGESQDENDEDEVYGDYKVYTMRVNGDDDYGALAAQEVGLEKLLSYCIENKVRKVIRSNFNCYLERTCNFEKLSDVKSGIALFNCGREVNDYDHSKNEDVFLFYQNVDTDEWFDETCKRIELEDQVEIPDEQDD